MSAGAFSNARYESDLGTVHLIKVQEETLTMTVGGTANAAPTDAIDSVFAAETSRGAKAYGLRPRKINVSFTTEPPTGYRPYTSLQLPILTTDLFEAISDDDVVVYAGGTGKVSSKVAENIRPGAAVLGGAATPEPE